MDTKRKQILTLILVIFVWFSFGISAYAAIDTEQIHEEKIRHLSFTSDEIINNVVRELKDLIKENPEITEYKYTWYTGGYNGMINWDIYIGWRSSVNILRNENMTASDLKVRNEAQRILKEEITNMDDDYQKVFEIFNWIQEQTEYDYDALELVLYRNENHPTGNAYGVFFNGKAICEGYSDAFYLLANMAGIESRLVDGGNHCWNAVKLEDKWYFLDVTAESGRCFLRGTEWMINNGYVLNECYMNFVPEKRDYMF